MGKGVETAVKNVNELIAPKLIGMDPIDQEVAFVCGSSFLPLSTSSALSLKSTFPFLHPFPSPSRRVVAEYTPFYPKHGCARSEQAIDKLMLEIDGTENKARLRHAFRAAKRERLRPRLKRARDSSRRSSLLADGLEHTVVCTQWRTLAPAFAHPTARRAPPLSLRSQGSLGANAVLGVSLAVAKVTRPRPLAAPVSAASSLIDLTDA
eukprot:6197606-Pleurochrysis_carterae.AAC.2